MDSGGLAATRRANCLRLRPPFSAMGGAVRLHVAGFDRRRQRKHALGNKGTKDAASQLPAGPAIEAVVDRRDRIVFSQAVLPPTAGLQHMRDTTYDAPISDPARARLVLERCGSIVAQASSSNQKSLRIIASVAKRGRGI